MIQDYTKKNIDPPIKKSSTVKTLVAANKKSVENYMKLTGLSHTQATKELKQIEKLKKIEAKKK